MNHEFEDEYELISQSEENATYAYKNNEAFYDGVEKENIDAAFEHIGQYVEGATKAAAGKGAELFAGDSDLKTLTVEYPYGPGEDGTVGVQMVRSDDGVSIRVGVKHPIMTPAKKTILSLQDKILSSIAEE